MTNDAHLFSDEEVARLRVETPGCAHVLHFNHAGSSLMPEPVFDAVVDHLQLEATIGGYEAADAAETRSEGVYASVAAMIGQIPQEIALIENATRAWDMAFYAIPFATGDRILTSTAEYASNVIAFLQMKERGVEIEVVPSDDQGAMSLVALENMLDSRVKVVSVSHMPTNSGLVQPVEAIGDLAKAHESQVFARTTRGRVPLCAGGPGVYPCPAISRPLRRAMGGASSLRATSGCSPVRELGAQRGRSAGDGRRD